MVRWPSVSMMIAAEEYEPGATGVNSFFSFRSPSMAKPRWRSRPLPCIAASSMPWSGNSVASEITIALPVAVARCSWKRSMAVTRSSRLMVGSCATCAEPAKATMPTFTWRGRSAMNALAAFCAATSRFGCTSVARMLPETSIARMMVCWLEGSVTTATGRAAAC